MKILFISAVLPFPLKSGGHIRLYHLLKRLSKKHEITLVCFYRDEAELKGLPEIAKFCHAVCPVHRGRIWQLGYLVKSALTKLSLLETSYDLPRAKNVVCDLLAREKFDLIHVEPFYASSVVPLNKKLPLVISEHNIEYQVYGEVAKQYRLWPIVNQLMSYDVWKMRRQERLVWQRATKVVAVSEEDKREIDKYRKNSDTAVVSNGVDLQQYKFQKWQFPQSLQFIFVGNFSWQPNVEAVQQLLTNIWPQIKEKYSKAQLTIIGRHLPQITAFRFRQARVEVREWVEDIGKVYKEATALLAPIAIAGGTKFKVLEAMAAGLPVITTKAGISGLKVSAGREVFVAETANDYLQVISDLQFNQTKVAAQTQAARLVVENNYSWDELSKELEKVWLNI